MTDTVVIKGNKHGLTIILNKDDAFDHIKHELGEKLLASRKFFGKSALTIAIKGRVLSNDEETELIEIIQSNSDLTVTCFVEDNLESDKESSYMTQTLKVAATEIEASEPTSTNKNNVAKEVATTEIIKMPLQRTSKKEINYKALSKTAESTWSENKKKYATKPLRHKKRNGL